MTKPFDYYLDLSIIILAICVTACFITCFILQRKNKDVHSQEIISFIFCNIAVCMTGIFAVVTEFIYSYYK